MPSIGYAEADIKWEAHMQWKGSIRRCFVSVGREQLNHHQIIAGGSSNLHEQAQEREEGERIARRPVGHGRSGVKRTELRERERRRTNGPK